MSLLKLFALFAVLAGLMPGVTALEIADRPLVEFSARGGLPNFFAKAERGDTVKVAYLGGSITAQPGYRVQSLDYFKKTFPNAKFEEINAAIGGTGSDLGVSRIEHDVLRFKPDLLFVEFAVNDAGAKPEEIVKSMEGIVRKTWRANPETDIIFVYTLTKGLLPDLQAGKYNRSAAVMETVADTYGVPSVHMGLEVARLEKEGKLLINASGEGMKAVSGDSLNANSQAKVNAEGKIPFSGDGVHPYPDTGHVLYMEALARALPQIKAVKALPGPHGIPAAMNAGNYQNVVMLDLDQTTMTGKWTKLPLDQGWPRSFASRIDGLWKGETDAALTFQFKGKSAKIYDFLTPDGGKLEITLDGKPFKVNRFDGYCTYSRLSLLVIGNNLDPAVVHTATVKVLPDELDKMNILFERNRPDMEKNPAKYQERNWYAGAVFIDGELVK